MSEEQQNKTPSEQTPEPKQETGDVAREVILAGQGRGPDGRLVAGCPPINPGGRPKTRMVRDAMLKYFKENPSALTKIIERAAEGAMAGEVQYFKEIRDMLDGKPAIAITGEEGGPLQIDVTDARSKLIADLL